MSTTKEELVAANIRRQIADLEELLKELESDPRQSKIISQRTRQVEKDIRQLRVQFGAY